MVTTHSTNLTPNQRAGRTRRANTRRDVLEATRRLLRDRSYDDLRVSEIVKTAQIGEATIYQAFGSKAAIVAALFLEDYEEVETEAERVLSSGTAATPTVIGAYLLQIARLAGADRTVARAYLRAFFSEAYLREPFPEGLEDLVRPGAFCQRLIDQGLRSGDLSRRLAVAGLGDLLIVAIVQTVLLHGPDEGAAIARQLVDATFVPRNDDPGAAARKRPSRKEKKS